MLEFLLILLVAIVALIPLAPIIIASILFTIFFSFLAGFFFLGIAWFILTWPIVKIKQLIKKN